MIRKEISSSAFRKLHVKSLYGDDNALSGMHEKNITK